MHKIAALFLVVSATALIPLNAGESYPPKDATRTSILADVFAKQLRPGMNEVEVSRILKSYEREVDQSKFHWISMLAGWVPLKLIFKREDSQGFMIDPPQIKLKGARNYNIGISATIQFDRAPESRDQQQMNDAARDFFKGKRRGKLLEFAIVCEILGPQFMKVFYFGPKTEQDAAANP
jgi:hypothetical protein